MVSGLPLEPSYNGHSLSHWLLTYSTNWSDSRVTAKSEAADAVRQIGTNALPLLLRWAQHKEPAWKGTLYMRLLWDSRKYHRTWIIKAARPLMPCRPERPDVMALTGFEILGPAAKPAMPALIKMTSDTSATNTAHIAICCLARIGPAAMPSLLNNLSNSNSPDWLRCDAAHLIARMARSENPSAIAHALKLASEDPNPAVSKAATDSLAQVSSAAHEDL